MTNPADCIQVTTLVGDRAAADALAALLIDERLAACVQVLGPVTSTYRWQGRREQAEEWMCVIKTTVERYAAVERTIGEHHRYELPEIIATPIVAGSPAYLAWVRTQVGPAADES